MPLLLITLSICLGFWLAIAGLGFGVVADEDGGDEWLEIGEMLVCWDVFELRGFRWSLGEINDSSLIGDVDCTIGAFLDFVIAFNAL